MNLEKNIFKAYDIRGIYPAELNEESAKIINNALIQHFHPKTILVSKDVRTSSPCLFKAIMDTIPEHIKTYYLELSTTPMLYFYAGKLDVDLSIMITASHNPPQYNGFKVSKKNVYPISGEEILSIIINNEKLRIGNEKLSNTNEHIEEIKEAVAGYREFLLKQIDSRNFKRVLKIACDCSNGTSGLVLTRLFQNLLIEAVFLCMMPNGNFPNHDPNPLIFNNIKHLSEFIKEGKFDLGIAFDGDADRVIFLDEKGNPVPSDLMLIYIARAMKIKKNISKVFIDTRSSQVIFEELGKLNISVERIKAGHLYMRKKLAENTNCFAGELSGHYYHKENYNSDAAILTMLYVLEQLSSENIKVSEIVNKFKKYVSSGELSYKVENKNIVLDKIDKYFSNTKKEYIDGISIYESDFYMNIRESNTENLVRVVIEAKTKEMVDNIQKKIENII